MSVHIGAMWRYLFSRGFCGTLCGVLMEGPRSTAYVGYVERVHQ